MNIINALTDTYGKDIIRGLSSNLGAEKDSVEKSVQGTLPALMGGLISKVKTKQGAAELFKLLNKKEYNGDLLSYTGSLFSGSEGINLLKNGLDVLPMVLGGQSKMGTILSIAGGLFGGGLSRSQSVFGMMAPVLLNFIGQKVSKDKLNQKGLVDLLNGQKDFVQKNTHKDIAKEMGFANWDSQTDANSTDEDSVVEEAYHTEESAASGKSFLTKWMWPLILIGSIAALFLLTKACGEIPEEKQKAMDAKKAQREQNRTQQQSQKGQTNQTLTNTNTNTKPKQANRNVPAKPKVNNNQPVKTTPNRPNSQNQTNNNAANRPNNTNTTPNTTATKPAGGRKGIQNRPQTTQTPKTTQTPQTQQPVKQQTRPTNNNVVQNNNRPGANTTATKPATQAAVKQNTSTPPATRPGVKQNTPTGGTKASTSNYRGSAGIVDKAARNGQTQIINFGTVTTDNQTLTRSAESNFKKIAQIMKDNPSTKISIRAHNQDYEKPAQNANAKKTGTIRANLLKQLLVDEGVQTNRINVQSLGNTEFLISKDPSNARNQRISVKVN